MMPSRLSPVRIPLGLIMMILGTVLLVCSVYHMSKEHHDRQVYEQKHNRAAKQIKPKAAVFQQQGKRARRVWA